MALIARRKRPLDRSTAHLRDTRLVVIATEGKVTEKQYFSLFNSRRVQVKVLPTGEENHSSPEHVLERLHEYHKTYDLDGDDELWLMVDVDRWGTAKLAQVAKEAIHAGFGLAVSNPCFEIARTPTQIDAITGPHSSFSGQCGRRSG
ncbi:MAG: RloB family protein [Candidatus Thiodiazotropha sp. (ex Epidulcina cf. delphinae)]|nr:RloB family protein [Candidatus Thiodiazotropha sp. (ex Epidulcina cf. delphinae)]